MIGVGLSSDLFLFLKKFQIVNGILQKTPPIVPKRIRLTRVSKSLLGAPNEAPNIGMMKVRNEIGINCFKLGSQQPMNWEIFFRANAENIIIPMKITRAAAKDGGSIPIFIIISATNVANIAPVPAPATNVCFQFISITNA